MIITADKELVDMVEQNFALNSLRTSFVYKQGMRDRITADDLMRYTKKIYSAKGEKPDFISISEHDGDLFECEYRFEEPLKTFANALIYDYSMTMDKKDFVYVPSPKKR